MEALRRLVLQAPAVRARSWQWPTDAVDRTIAEADVVKDVASTAVFATRAERFRSCPDFGGDPERNADHVARDNCVLHAMVEGALADIKTSVLAMVVLLQEACGDDRDLIQETYIPLMREISVSVYPSRPCRVVVEALHDANRQALPKLMVYRNGRWER